MSHFIKTITVCAILLAVSPITVNAACSKSYEALERDCDAFLQSAYAPGMAVFNSCQTKCESDEDGVLVIKMIIKFQGGILGTPYVLKGRVIIDANRQLMKIRWAYWNSPLTPLNRTEHFEANRDKWDF